MAHQVHAVMGGSEFEILVRMAEHRAWQYQALYWETQGYDAIPTGGQADNHEQIKSAHARYVGQPKPSP